MIEINLLPGAGKKKKSSRPQAVDFGAMAAGVGGRLRDKFMIAAVLGVVLSVSAVAMLYTMQNKRDATLLARQEKAVQDSTHNANLLKDRYQAEQTRDTVLRQVNLIRSLDEDRYVWPHVLDEVSRALPQYTWITSISFTGTAQGTANVVLTPKTTEDTSAAAKKRRQGPKRLDTVVPKDVITIRLMGHTVDIQALTRFWKDLEASPFLAGVQLDKSEPVVEQGKDVTQFQLTLGYSRPDTALLHRVPLSLPVR
jgi:Tfp pilus assembly protein PilN